jgi:thiosulfate reductase cytochrome b subunit
MDFFLRWRKRIPTDELSELEAFLKKSLKPVMPQERFVHELRLRLLEEITNAPDEFGYRPWQILLMIAIFFLSVSLAILTGLRVLIAIAGIFGLMQKSRAQLETLPPAPSLQEEQQ